MAALNASVIELAASQVGAYPAPPGERYYFLQATDAPGKPLYKWSGLAWAIASIFEFVAPLTTTVVPTRSSGSPTATYSRATTATVTDWENIVRPALSGETRFQGARRVRNLLTFSQDFTNAAWTKGANVTITNSGFTAPDGTATAQKYTLAAHATPQVTQVITLNTANKTIRISVWVYPLLSTVAFLQILRDGVAIFTATNIAVVPNQWQRLSLGTTADGTASTTAAIYFGDSSVPTGDMCYFWGAQIEDTTGQSNTNPAEYVSVGVLAAPYQGANVDGVQYFATQNGNTVAANVVTAGTGAAIPSATLLGYLAEGARTNLCLQSEAFDNAVWVKTNVSVTANNAIAPDGNTTADTLTATLALGTCLQAITIGTASQTASCWVKRRTGAGVINLSADGVTFTPIAVTAAWQRFQVTQSLVAGVVNAFFRIDTNGDAIDVWGAQYETATFASSYIPTTTVAVPRNADVLTYASAGNVSLGSGTFYSEINIPVINTATQHQAIVFDDGTVNNYIDMRVTVAGVLGADLVSGGVVQASLLGSGITVGAVNKLAVNYTTNSVRFFKNGALDGSKTGGVTTPVALTEIGIGIFAGIAAQSLFGTIRNVQIARVQAADTSLQALTT